jgi:hypothetical protein
MPRKHNILHAPPHCSSFPIYLSLLERDRQIAHRAKIRRRIILSAVLLMAALFAASRTH